MLLISLLSTILTGWIVTPGITRHRREMERNGEHFRREENVHRHDSLRRTGDYADFVFAVYGDFVLK